MKNNRVSLFLKNPIANGTVYIDAAYDVTVSGEKKKRVLTPKGEVVDVSPKSTVEKKDIALNSQNLWTFTIDLSLDGVNADDIRSWVKENPNISKEGSPENTFFVYRFDDESIEESFTEDEEKAEVFSKYGLLDEEQQTAVAIYFGVSPFNLGEKELKNHMVGLSNGLITNDKNHRLEFLNKLDRIFDEVSLNVRCAIQQNIINKSDNNIFTIQGEVLGSSLDAAILVVKQRDEIYAIIERELKAIGKYLTTTVKAKQVKEEHAKAVKQEKIESDLEDLGIAPSKKSGKAVSV
jgi:hypothetical protein